MAISILQTLAETCMGLDRDEGGRTAGPSAGTAGLGGGSVQPRLL
jgi:hypothetical protein